MGLKRFLKVHKASLSFLLILIIFSASFLVMIRSYNLGGVAVGMLGSTSEPEGTKASTDGGVIPGEEAEAIDSENTIEIVEPEEIELEHTIEGEEEIIDLIVRPLPDRKKIVAGDTVGNNEYFSVLGGVNCGDGICDNTETLINCKIDCEKDMKLYPIKGESLLYRLIEFFNNIFKKETDEPIIEHIPYALPIIASTNGTGNLTNQTQLNNQSDIY